MAGGIATVAEAIAADMRGRLPRQHKRQREGLALLTATMPGVRSANLTDLAASLPRSAERPDMRYQWISRLLGNPLVDADAVMAPHARELLARLAAEGRTVVLMVDQTRATGQHQMVMVAARVGGRALPLAWRVRTTRGAIGFVEQREALEAVARLLPGGAAGADGRPVPRHARPDRLVPRAGLGLAAAAQAGPPGVRGRWRDRSGRVFRAASTC